MQKKILDFYVKQQKWILIGLTIIYLILSSLYPVFNRPRAWTFYFGIIIDDWIPFIPAWIVIYVIWYLYLPIIGLMVLLKDRQLYFRWILAFTFGIGSCFLLYSIFQTTVPRPDVTSSDLFTSMVRLIYSNDLPYNCFPSIHVMTSYISILVLRNLQDYNRYVTLGLTILGWLINFSTLFVKQHVFADMVSGVLLAIIVYWVADKVVSQLSVAKTS